VLQVRDGYLGYIIDNGREEGSGKKTAARNHATR